MGTQCQFNIVKLVQHSGICKFKISLNKFNKHLPIGIICCSFKTSKFSHVSGSTTFLRINFFFRKKKQDNFVWNLSFSHYQKENRKNWTLTSINARIKTDIFMCKKIRVDRKLFLVDHKNIFHE